MTSKKMSFDLSTLKEETPLYSICRAWVANQPKNKISNTESNPSQKIPTETHSIDHYFDKKGNMKDIISLLRPLPMKEATLNMPSIPIVKEELNLDYDGQILQSQEELMKEHRERWRATRNKFHQQARMNELRYAESSGILTAMFKRSQSQHQ